jgi:hypothetical protein
MPAVFYWVEALMKLSYFSPRVQVRSHPDYDYDFETMTKTISWSMRKYKIKCKDIYKDK